MEAPETKYYTPRKDRKHYAYRFNVKLLPPGCDDSCSVEIVGRKAIIRPGTIKRLVREAAGREVYFRLHAGILPATKYRADQYSDRLELVWEEA